MKDYLACNIKS